MTFTDDDLRQMRREVAARLRDDDYGYEPEYDFLVQVLGMPRENHRQCDWSKVNERLADLIDPTCEMDDAGDVPASVKDNLNTFFCSECGAPVYNDKGMTEHGLVRLPVDADGEYIHVGDTLDGYGKTIEVVEMRYGRGGWVLISRDGSGYADTFAFAHRHAPTVEDVLREFAEGLGVPVADSYVAASAAKLRLAGDGEEQ